jgi:hypothetical protein
MEIEEIRNRLVVVANDFSPENGPGESASWAQGLIHYIEALPDDDAQLVMIAELVLMTRRGISWPATFSKREPRCGQPPRVTRSSW